MFDFWPDQWQRTKSRTFYIGLWVLEGIHILWNDRHQKAVSNTERFEKMVSNDLSAGRKFCLERIDWWTVWKEVSVSFFVVTLFINVLGCIVMYAILNILNNFFKYLLIIKRSIYIAKQIHRLFIYNITRNGIFSCTLYYISTASFYRFIVFVYSMGLSRPKQHCFRQ